MKTTKKMMLSAIAALLVLPMLAGCQLSQILGTVTTTAAPTADSTAEPVATAPVPDAMDFSTVDISKYIDLNYKNIALSVTSLPITPNDAEVEKELSDILISYGYYDIDTSAEKTSIGDYIEMDYTGIMDGETFDGGTSEKATIYLDPENSGYIDGFADGLIGVTPGSVVTLELTFPQNYYEDLAGKPVTFKVNVHGICRVRMTDETIAEFSDGKYKTVADYKEYLKDYLTEISGYNAFSEVGEELLERILENSEVISYPEEQYDYYYSIITNSYVSYAADAGMDYESFLLANGITAETIDSDIKSYIKSDLVLHGIAAAEDIALTDEEYDEYVNKYYSYYAQYLLLYGYTKEQIVELLREQAFNEAVLFAAFGYCELSVKSAE